MSLLDASGKPTRKACNVCHVVFEGGLECPVCETRRMTETMVKKLALVMDESGLIKRPGARSKKRRSGRTH